MIVWGIFCIVALCMIFVGINRGFIKSGISLIVNILNFIISFAITRLIINSLSIKVGKIIVNSLVAKYGDDLEKFNTMTEFIKFASSIAIGVVVFYIIYLLLHIILSILKHFLFYQKTDSVKLKMNPILEKALTIVVTLASVSLTFMVLFTPFGIIYTTAATFVPDLSATKVPFVSNTYFDKLTEMPDNKNDVKATKEIDYTLQVAGAIAKIGLDEEDTNKTVKEFKRNFSKSHFLPTVISEVGSTAAKQWKNGESYFDFEFEIPEGREGELTLKVLTILEDWNKKVVIDDVSTLVEIYALIDDYGTEKFHEDDGLLIALTDEIFMEELFVKLYRNDDFADLIPAVLEYGIYSAFDAAEMEVNEKDIPSFDVKGLSEEEIREEARIVSGIIRTTLEISKQVENSGVTEEDVETIVNELSKLKDNEELNTTVNDLVNQLEANF